MMLGIMATPIPTQILLYIMEQVQETGVGYGQVLMEIMLMQQVLLDLIYLVQVLQPHF